MEQRGTSLSQLNDPPPTEPVQTAMHTGAPTDNELVDDILKEINQNQGDVVGTGALKGDGGVTSAEYQQQVDTQVQHNLPPATTQDVHDYQQAEIDTTTLQSNGEVPVSEGERLLREQSPATEPTRGFLGSLDLLQFAKTLLLTMILFIVVTNTHTQSLVCRIPYFCNVVNGVMQLNFVGTSVIALLCGVVLASVQAFV
jgi:hypothetical protein